MKERTFYITFLCCASILIIIFDRVGVHAKRNTVPSAMSSGSGGTTRGVSTTTTKPSQIRIFCYGDSLTAGTSPPEFQMYPYAPHLERALLTTDGTTTTPNILVRHKGLPGWTSQKLLQEQFSAHGLATALRNAAATTTTTDSRSTSASPPVHIAILLAGTNDLGYAEAQPILDNIIQLHQVCLTNGVVHTIAIGIPPSAFQFMYADAAAKADTINRGLAQYCESHKDQSTYVPFPFSFRSEDFRTNDLSSPWAPDGLHCSPRGYQILGESLAPVVNEILGKITLV